MSLRENARACVVLLSVARWSMGMSSWFTLAVLQAFDYLQLRFYLKELREETREQ